MIAHASLFVTWAGLLSSQGMAVFTIGLGLGAFALSRVFKPRRQSFPAVAAAPSRAVAGSGGGGPTVIGRASGEMLVTSPFTHTPCCYYYAEIEQDLPVLDLMPASEAFSGPGGWNWSNIHTTASFSDFLLQDSQGSIRVSPAVLGLKDVPVTFEYQVPERDRSEQDRALVDYVAKNCPDKWKTRFAELAQAAFVSEEQAADPRYQQRLQEWRRRRERMFQRPTKGQRFRFRERCILPGGEYALGGRVQQGGDGERRLMGRAEQEIHTGSLER